jgi:hypothetical protein
MEPSADVVRWLVSAEGLDLLEQAVSSIRAGAAHLQIATTLRARDIDTSQTHAVLSAAMSRLRSEGTYPAGSVFTKEALEQASPPAAARWRAQRFGDAGIVFDLCSGAGADASELATFARVVAVDRSESRAVLAKHNTRSLDVEVIVGDALAAPLDATGFFHVDPSRRTTKGRPRRLAEYEPAVPDLLSALSPAEGACVLVSPGIDLADPGLPGDAEQEFIQIGPDLVECALWLGSLRRARASATLLPQGITLTRDDDPIRLPPGKPGSFLIVPVPAVTRARIHERLGAEINARKIDRDRALMTTDEDPGHSAWWSSWRIEAHMAMHARGISAWLRSAPPLPLEIEFVGYRGDLERMWHNLGRPARGPNGRRLFVVAERDGARAYLCVKA